MTRIDLLANPMTTAEDIIVGGTSGVPERLAAGSEGDVLKIASGAVAWGAPSGSSVEDPITDAFGAADTAFEFDTSSLTGLTAIGTATAEDADTSVPGHYYVKKAATAGIALTGRYAASPSDGSTPFTAITKLTDHTVYTANAMRLGGLFIGEATPGKVNMVHKVFVSTSGGDIGMAAYYTNPTTFNADIGSRRVTRLALPVYYAIVVTTATSVAYYWSENGRIWFPQSSGNNPGFTIGSVGITVDPEQATIASVGAYDYLRIWNSALTLP